MAKAAILIAIGMGIGAAAVSIIRPWPALPPTASEPNSASSPVRSASPAAGGDAIGQSYEELLRENEELLDLIEELESVLRDVQLPQAAPGVVSPLRASGVRSESTSVVSLVNGGFTRERAEWLNSRYSELHSQNVLASISLEEYSRSPKGLLREEIGDIEFEKFVTAIGGSPSVQVGSVTEGSLAALAGLREGDEIVTYDGHRVFDTREVVSLSGNRTTGQSVIVDITRDGQPLQLVLPGGPIEAQLSADGFYVAPSFYRDDSSEGPPD